MVVKRYFSEKKSVVSRVVPMFLIFLFAFSVIFFLWSLMKYNKIMEDKRADEAYIEQLNDEIERLQYLVDAPLDDEFKIRVAREKLGMCFPDEIIFHTELE